MSLTGIALIIIGVAFCILVLTLIPTFLAVKRTATSVSLLCEIIQREHTNTLQEITTELADFKTITKALSKHNEDVARFIAALGEARTILHTIIRAVGAATIVLRTSSIRSIIVKVAGKYILERYLNKRGTI